MYIIQISLYNFCLGSGSVMWCHSGCCCWHFPCDRWSVFMLSNKRSSVSTTFLLPLKRSPSVGPASKGRRVSTITAVSDLRDLCAVLSLWLRQSVCVFPLVWLHGRALENWNSPLSFWPGCVLLCVVFNLILFCIFWCSSVSGCAWWMLYVCGFLS